jgi:hypothetical protein
MNFSVNRLIESRPAKGIHRPAVHQNIKPCAKGAMTAE